MQKGRPQCSCRTGRAGSGGTLLGVRPLQMRCHDMAAWILSQVGTQALPQAVRVELQVMADVGPQPLQSA
eukprot:16315415-Heterocapsa_arctica.AAC.1